MGATLVSLYACASEASCSFRSDGDLCPKHGRIQRVPSAASLPAIHILLEPLIRLAQLARRICTRHRRATRRPTKEHLRRLLRRSRRNGL